MDLDKKVAQIIEEAEALSETDLRGAQARLHAALALNPDYPNLEDEIFIREDAISKLDGVLEFIVVLLREGKDYEACEMLQSLPDNYIIKDKSGLVHGLVDKITKVQGLVEQAKEQAKSDCMQALATFDEAFSLVSDYPNLAKDIAALKVDVKQYNALVNSIEKALKGKKATKATDLLGQFREAFPDDAHVGRFKVAIINLGKNVAKDKDKKTNLLKIVVIVGVVIAAVAGYFAYEMVMISRAEQQWQQARQLLAARDFIKTKAACLDVKQNLGKVHILFRTRKHELQDKVSGVLQAEDVVQGVAGKVLFDGGYIPKEQMTNSTGIKKKIDEGEALAKSGDFVGAILILEKALAATADLDAQTAAGVGGEINKLILGYHLNVVRDLVVKVEALRVSGAYDVALVKVAEAMQVVTKHAIDAGEPVVIKLTGLKQKVMQAKLAELLDTGEELFVAGSYDAANKTYKKAYSFADTNGLANKALTRQVSSRLNKSKVASLLDSGDGYMASGKWLEANRAYESGVALAVKVGLQDMASVKSARTNLQKVKKMQVLADLERQNQLAVAQFKADKRRKAKNLFTKAIKTGEGSQWRTEREMVAVLNKLKGGLAEVVEKNFIEDKKQFLYDRSSTILKKDFGLGASTTLLDPTVVLLDATPKFLKFSLSAMLYLENGGATKYSRYEATYGYDREKRSWRLLEKLSAGPGGH